MANPWGLLHYGIPSFKLDKDIARTRIAKLELIDVKFICNTRVGGDDIQVDGLREQYDAVFLGIGVPIGHKIKLPGEDLTGVNQATEFLVRSNLTLDDLPETLKRLPGIGKNVVAIDGSDISTDCVRTASRLQIQDGFTDGTAVGCCRGTESEIRARRMTISTQKKKAYITNFGQRQFALSVVR